ncbi:HD-GYP domain-containing protein [Novipirellula artificiosorum]|uniref:Cyclic di-GMP phosphodiesterase response regulator RpfG n=1 Tax=Novipirellula artificiosorum TaxID=2528016 RepID=A0A5C6DKL2_9BACT|nr:HD-GYP domain-containing protein [Novipirellula artificiosorum]TWU37400.1 Cyclic di-GMP phosphodiesterase response regulator RpfG [Novipirellula artificiosorum]
MSSGDYLPISVATLLPAKAVGLNLFQKEEESDRLMLYRGSDYPLNMDDLDRLRGRGVHLLYIAKDSGARYQAYLRRLLDPKSDSATVTPQLRAGALNEVVLDVLRTSFGNRHVTETVASIGKLGALTAEIITRDEFAVSDLFRVLHHDYATFTHSTNVAFYSGILAAALGYSQEEVERITTGGLLHDLGKLEIDDRILCKPGKLDEKEFRQVKRHPSLGFRKLAKRTDLCEGQLMMVYQHHERLDGKGYPVGNVGKNIHPWAKVCAVADVFEALTSQRPYRQPLSRAKALEIQQRDSGTAFDPEVLECWTAVIQNA